MTKMIFFGNWGIGQLTLEEILALDSVQVIAVVTQRQTEETDPYASVIIDKANANGINIYHSYSDLPSSVIKSVDLAISVGYNEIFPNGFISQLKIYNFHPSKLPYFRGPSPIPWQIKNCRNTWHFTIHEIDAGIDTGEVVLQGEFVIDRNKPFCDALDEFNAYAASFIRLNLPSLIEKATNNSEPYPQPYQRKGKYYPRISIPRNLMTASIFEIEKYLNRTRICIFTGNRAEFGILVPLIISLQSEYYIDLIISGSHTNQSWNTKTEIKKIFSSNRLIANIIEVKSASKKSYYQSNFEDNFSAGFKYFEKNCSFYETELSIVLGDRVETYGFAIASFFNKVPICHLFGGDISNVPYFDTNIRHSITKISHIHFASNIDSLNNLLRMGEEKERCHLMGNISLDNYTIGNYARKNELINDLQIQDQIIFLLTYHPSQYINAEDNLQIFKYIISDLSKFHNYTVITYPNNDPGGELIIEYLDSLQPRENIKVYKNLGIRKYLGLLKEFDCIVIGNSSSGLFETAYTGTPTINIGDRQIDRPKARNVIDIDIKDLEILKSQLSSIITNYSEIKNLNLQDRGFFGLGKSSETIMNQINNFFTLTKEKRFFKKFV